MQKIEVLIEENAFGSVRPVEIVADAPVGALVPALVEELKLPQTDLFGKQLVYMLRQASGGRILPDNTTLVASGIEPGTRLALDSYVIDGSVATLLSNAPQQSLGSTLHSSRTIADSGGFSLQARGNTSAIMPILKKQRKWPRRAFLLLGGVVLGVAGTGASYAAYHALTTGALTNLLSPPKANGVPKQTIVQPPAQMKPLLPTMAQSVLSFTQHQQVVRSVSWSADGKMLASGADDAQLLIWGTDGVVHQTIPHPASVRALAWAPDGQRIVTGSGTNVTFFNTQNGAMIARPANHRHRANVTSLSWTPHNQMQVVSGGLDTRAIVWDTVNYRAQAVFVRHTAAIEGVSWAADGQTVASASQGGVVRVWDSANVQEIHGFYQDMMQPLRTAAFAPAGLQQLAVGGDDGVVRLWNGLTCQQQNNNGQCVDMPQRLQAAQGIIRTLAWSPDARFLAVGADDGTLSVWYPGHNQTPLLSVPQHAPVYSIAWSPNGNQLAAASGTTVTIWNLM